LMWLRDRAHKRFPRRVLSSIESAEARVSGEYSLLRPAERIRGAVEARKANEERQRKREQESEKLFGWTKTASEARLKQALEKAKRELSGVERKLGFGTARKIELIRLQERRAHLVELRDRILRALR
ncbi:hypothetical protein HY546_02050, partial [archaeon]|nr:hypothetical protein [archaeon]